MAEMSKAKKDKKAKAASANRDAATPRSSTWRVRYDNFVEQHATHMFIAAAILFFVAMIALKLAFSYVEGLASAALLSTYTNASNSCNAIITHGLRNIEVSKSFAENSFYMPPLH